MAGEKATASFHINKDVLQRVAEVAEATDRSKSSVMSEAVRQWLATRDGPKTMDQLGLGGGIAPPPPQPIVPVAPVTAADEEAIITAAAAILARRNAANQETK